MSIIIFHMIRDKDSSFMVQDIAISLKLLNCLIHPSKGGYNDFWIMAAKMFPVEIQLFIDAFPHFGDLRRHYLQYLVATVDEAEAD
jgi:hypothetical protein